LPADGDRLAIGAKSEASPLRAVLTLTSMLTGNVSRERDPVHPARLVVVVVDRAVLG
jgi:hypothetical protein